MFDQVVFRNSFQIICFKKKSFKKKKNASTISALKKLVIKTKTEK